MQAPHTTRPALHGNDDAAIRYALIISGATIASQVGGRALREALFLSAYHVTNLPLMVASAASVTLLSAVVAAKAMGRWGPGRFLPVLFASSALLLVAEYGLLKVAPRLTAVVYFLHFNALGALLISGFWSLISERFDPRTAKRAIGQIGSAGTLGGVAGGLLAATAAVKYQTPLVLLMLAALHATCALLVPRLGPAPVHSPADAKGGGAPFKTLLGSPYLRTIAAVVLLAAVSEGLLDYVLKAAAKDTYASAESLLRFFAVFYTWTAIIGAALGAVVGRAALERMGLARTVGLLPWTVAAAGAGAIAFPSLGSAMIARGSESVVRNSLFRSGYELLFTALPASEKRPVKALLDVGAVRIGDMIAAALIAIVAAALRAPGVQAPRVMLVLAVVAAAAAIALTFSLHAGYVATLERNLLHRAILLDMDEVKDATTRLTLAHTMAALPVLPAAGEAPAPVAAPAGPTPLDAVTTRLTVLRSRDPERVREALGAGPLEAEHVATAITLLAWDEVAAAARKALEGAAPRHTGQLVDALLDPDADFAVRRRVAAPLAKSSSQRAMDGLVAGLTDRRFEVRYRCGRALTRLHDSAPELSVNAELVYAAVLREAEADRRVWESQRLLEREDDDPLALGEALKERASRSLEHVFTVLALVLPRQPLQIAFRGLHTSDPMLRGTALEYLEIALPTPVRVKLWPFLDDNPGRARRPRPDEQVIAELLGSSDSIASHLAARGERKGA